MSRLRWRLLVIEAFAALALARLGLALLPIRRLMGGAGCRAADGTPYPGPTPDIRAAAIGRAIVAAARRAPWRASCLVQALAGRAMLARRRIPADIHFGVASQDGEVRAHAWLIAAGGMVCGGGEAGGYVPIVSFSPLP